MAVWLWLLIAGGLFVVEMITADLLFASLAISAGAAMVTAWAGGGFVAQGISFAVSALLTIFVLRPIALREIAKRSPQTATNTTALLGVEATTTTAVSKTSGEVRLRGEIWSARTTGGTIPEGRLVIVDSIDGATAIVSEPPTPSS
jgi:membrane protein implicated in regulation of membrane protease activity